jgi:hypothetical protein
VAASPADTEPVTVKTASLPVQEAARAAASVDGPGVVVGEIAEPLFARDAEPTKESPLLYRERHYYVPEGTPSAVARETLLLLFAQVQESIASRPKGKLVKMALFDHRWHGQPTRPPVIALQWKDWRGQPEIIESPRPSAPPIAPAPMGGAEAAHRVAEAEALRQAASAEAARRAAEEQAARLAAQADAARRAAEEEAARQAEAAQRAAAAEAARKAAEEEAARLAADAEIARRAAEVAAAEAEAARRAAEEEAARRVAEADAARSASAQAAARRAEEAEEAATRAAEEAIARVSEAQARLTAEAEAARAAERARLEAEGEALRSAEEARAFAEQRALAEQRAEEAAARREADEEMARRAEEVEAARRAEEQALARLREESEAKAAREAAEQARALAEPPAATDVAPPAAIPSAPPSSAAVVAQPTPAPVPSQPPSSAAVVAQPTPSQPAPGPVPRQPPPAAPVAPDPPPAQRSRPPPAAAPAPSAATNERLADAFEGLQDLFFLQSPLEGAEFVLRLLNETVPCEAASIALYDINSNELRFVATSGPGAMERKGDAVPTNVGLVGESLLVYGRCLRVADVSEDHRFDPGLDGRVGLEVLNVLLKPVHAGDRLLGLIQLLNRVGDVEFSASDESVLTYVADKLGEFLAQSKAAADKPRPRAPVRR